MRKRLLAMLMTLCFLVTVNPLWSAAPTTTAKKKKTVTTATKPAVKPAPKPATKTTTKAVAKPAAKKKPAAKPAAKKKSAVKPAVKKTTDKATTKSTVSAASQKALANGIGTLREVWMRKITLEYLSDKRSGAHLASILADFPKRGSLTVS